MSAFELKLDAAAKSKLQQVISTKLASISSYTDDVLPEYVMVMVQNKKTMVQVAADLSAFLGKDAPSFSEWLWELLDGFSKGTPIPGAASANVAEEPKEETKPQARKLSSVIAAASPQNERTRNREPRRDREPKPKEGKREERGRGERRYERRTEEEMEEEERVPKPSVSSTISAVEVEKRVPPKDLNMPSRLILSAVKQAVDDANVSQSSSSSRKVVKPGSRSARMDEGEISVVITLDDNKTTKKRGSWDNEATEEGDNKKPKQIRCQYWPNCKRGESCVFHHPKDRCKNYPNCPFGDQCLFIHPISETQCKYGSGCSRTDCTFTHPPPASNVPCKGGFACYVWNGDSCGFVHPPVICKFGDKCTKGSSCSYSHGSLCKYGSRCTRPGCSFAHSTTSTKPARMGQSQTTCKFGLNCKNKETCSFVHPDDSEGVDTTSLSESLPKTPPKNDE